MHAQSIAASALAALALVAGTALPADAGGRYEYTFTSSSVVTETSSGVGDDTGLCDAVETATLHQHETIHVSATRPGLSRDDVQALIDDDPDGVVVRVTYTTTGTFHVLSGGHTYDGHFTQWFGGGLAGPQFVVTAVFTVVGRSELGTPLHAHFVAHNMQTMSGTKLAFDKGDITGCLPPV
jgi:hypothetical protein